MSLKPKFRYNPDTLSYEKVRVTFWGVLRRIGLFLLTGVCLGVAFFFLYVHFVESPREKQLSAENARLKSQYKLLERRMDDLQLLLSDLQQRDDNLYRVILQADPIPDGVRHSALGNNSRYDDFADMMNATLLTEATKRVDDLAKQIYIQSQSYDEVVKLVKVNDQKLRCIPAIQPVLNKNLKRMASGYGWRIDPVYHTRRFHAGMDFTAPTGTDVYVTGDGVVESAGWRQGYGNCITVDHGFGYTTLYAHLHKIKVKKGQRLTRSEIIAEVGNTGKSTGPHLHYEVRFHDKPVDPRNYYFLDLSPEQYDEMIQLSQNAGQMFD
jgi:murein DD-endopeptidase MepM/ murein hydrolase activator NlpD